MIKNGHRKLGDVFSFKNGKGFKKTEWSNTGLPIIRIQNLNDDTAPFNHFSGEYNSDILVKSGDLLFSWSGTVGSSFGPHLWTREAGVLNQHIFKVGIIGGLEKRYSFYALQHITAEIEQSVSGAVGLVHITKEKLNNFTIPVPALPEQRRIVGILDEAFEGIAKALANAEANLNNARELFESELNAVFSNPGPDWVETRLEKVLIAQPRNGWSPPAAYHAGSGTPVLTLSSVTGFVFNEAKIKFTSAQVDSARHYWVHNGDLLITRSNTPELVGHVAVVSGIKKPTIYPDLIMKMCPDPQKALSEFLYYQLRTLKLRREIVGKAQGANPTMKKINKQAVQSLPVRYPSLNLQKAIIAKLDELAAETKRLEAIYRQKLALLAELKQSLLHKAFSGEL